VWERVNGYMVEIGPNALAAILAVVGLMTGLIALWRAERIATLHTITQQQVTRNETPAQARITEQIEKGK
jgi:hypothetical protein